MENMAVLKRMSLFQGLDSLELIQVSKLVKHRHYHPDEVVVKEGDQGDSLFVVKGGEFHAYSEEGGPSKRLARFTPTDTFGELALIDRGARSATVAALTEGELLEFDYKAFTTLIGHSQALRMKVFSNLTKDLAAKLRNTNDRLIQLL